MSLSARADGVYDPFDKTYRIKQDAGTNFINLVGSQGATTIKSGSGNLRNVTVNQKASAAQTFKLYDALGASGTTIATIDAANPQNPYEYFAKFSTGLTAIFSASNAGTDVTLTWY